MKRSLTVLLTFLLLLSLTNAMAEEASNVAKSPIRLGGSGDDSIVRDNVLPLLNGNLLLSISTHRGRSGQAETKRSNTWAWLICLKPDGSTLWETEFGEERGTTSFGSLTEQPGETVTGYLSYSIDQHSQYRQKQTYSLKDGSLLWQGEREPMTDPNIFVTINTAGSRHVRKESISEQAKRKLRYYSLEEADGKVLWRVESESIGLRLCEGALSVPKGTLLYGCQTEDGTRGEKAKALLMDDQGEVLWSMTMDDLKDARLMFGLAAGNDRALLAGVSRDPYERLLLLIDTASGGVIWRRQYRDEGDTIHPISAQLETEQGFLLADVDARDHSGFIYMLVGNDGTEHKPWQVTFKDTAFIGLDLLQWNKEVWAAYNIEQDGDTDVMLERLLIPEQIQ